MYCWPQCIGHSREGLGAILPFVFVKPQLSYLFFMKAMLEKHTNYLAIIELLSKFVYLSLIPFGKGDLSVAFLLSLSCFTHQTI